MTISTKVTATFALLLTLTFTISLIVSPSVYAQTYGEKTTYCYIIATPNPVGVGTPVHVIFGITDYVYEYPDGWEGLTVTVTDQHTQQSQEKRAFFRIIE